MIKTFKIKHHVNLDEMLKRAFQVALFVVEHKNSWSGANPGLAKSLDGQSGFVYKLSPDVTTGNNVSVTINDYLS
jgi:hypothetical protein